MAGKLKPKASREAVADPSLPEVQHRARRLRLEAQRAARLAAFDAGLPTPEQQRKNVYETVKVKDPDAPAARLVKRNMTGLAIDRYLHRGVLSDRQHRAVKRYVETYARGGYERSITSNYSAAGGSRPTSPNESGILAATHGQIDARAAFDRARAALPTSLASRFDRIVLHEHDVAAVGADHGKPGTLAARMAVEWVRICCDELVNFYRL